MPSGPLTKQPTWRQAPADGHPMGVSVVIVTYRNEADIGPCLSAAGEAVPGIPMEVIVVNNASDDGTVAAARAIAGTKVIERQANGGFAAGCATGADAATGQWLLFLNPDTVIAPDAVQALLDCAQEHPDTGIVGGRFVHPDGTTDPRSFWGRPSPWSAACFALGLSSLLPGSRTFDPEAPQPWSADPTQERPVPVVSGAFMLVRRQLWDTLGGFDPVFFLYGEDADFCLRAAAAGCRPIVTARAVCQHAGGRSSTGPASWCCCSPARPRWSGGTSRPGSAAPASASCWAACCCGPRRAGSPVPPRRPARRGRPHTGKTGGPCGPLAMNGVVVGPDSAHPQARKRLRCQPAALR